MPANRSYNHLKLGRWSAIFLVLLMLSAEAGETLAGKTQRLALLVAASWEGEVAMHHDLVAMHDALRLRGFQAEDILTLDGPLNRESFVSFLKKARERMGKWHQGELLFYFGGHGTF